MTSSLSIPRQAESRERAAEQPNLSLILVSLLLAAFAYGVLGVDLVPALPLFERVLHTDETGATWLLTAFFLSAAGSSAILGRLGDMFGKRLMLLVSLGILAAGTLLSALATSLTAEIVGRVLQGSAGGLFPLAFGIVRDEFPAERVRGAIAGLTGMISLGAVGMLLPGLLIPHVSWHWLFWIPLIPTIAAILGTWFFVRESAVRPGGRVNWLNATLMLSGVTAVLVGVSEGTAWGWGSGRTLAFLIGGAGLCVAWVIAETVSENPVIDLSLMRLRAVWSTNIYAFLIGAGMYGAFAVYPVFAELPKSLGFGYQATLLHSGLYILPLSVLFFGGSLLAPRVQQRLGAVPVLVIGGLLTAAGFGFMAIWHSHPVDMMISLGLAGAGFGLSMPVLFVVVLLAVPAASVGEVSGMNTVVRYIGGAVGTQIVSILITNNTRYGIPELHGFTGSFISLAGFMAVAALAGVIVSTHRTSSAAAQ